MKRAALALAAVATLAGCAAEGGRRPGLYDRVLTARADPSAVVATEIAFARAAQDEGQWTAFARYATADAVLFVPGPVSAQAWLKGRANPAQAVRWQAHEIWSSCDGSLAVSRGAAQWPGGAPGEFLTVWQRQKDGAYRWVADVGQVVAAPLPAPELIATHVADCATPVPAALRQPAPAGAAPTAGESADGSLRYRIEAVAGGTDITVEWWDGTLRRWGPKAFRD